MIPQCMSTQHPDNVNSPFFSSSSEIGGEEEIAEAFYVFYPWAVMNKCGIVRVKK